MFLDQEGFMIVTANREMPAMHNLPLHNHQIIPVCSNMLAKESLPADPAGDAPG